MQEEINKIEQALFELEVPSTYLNTLLDKPWFQEEPFRMLYLLSKTEQSPIYHPEGNVWKHTMLVVNEAAKVRNLAKQPKEFMWAALLHDIGKPDTTRMKKGKITAYNHDRVGAPLARKFLSCFFNDEEFIQSVVSLVYWHMSMLYSNRNLPFGNIEQMIQEVSIRDISLLAWCDRMGRTNADAKVERQEVEMFYNTMVKIENNME